MGSIVYTIGHIGSLSTSSQVKSDPDPAKDQVKIRSGRPMKVLHQLVSESETESETETVTVRSKPVQSSPARIKNLDSNERTVSNMTEKRWRMEDKLNGSEPGNGKFFPTEEDKAWERVNIIAPTFARNKKSALNHAEMSLKSQEEVIWGELPTDKKDKGWIPSTYLHYIHGACLIMEILMESINAMFTTKISLLLASWVYLPSKSLGWDKSNKECWKLSKPCIYCLQPHSW